MCKLSKKCFISAILILILLIIAFCIGILVEKHHYKHKHKQDKEQVKFKSKTVNKAPKEIAAWIKKRAQGTGWEYVDWENTKLAVLSKNTPKKFNKIGENVQKDLNKRFMTTKSQQNKYGDFVDTGVLVHEWDVLAESSLNSLFNIKQDIIATSYLRSDITKKLNEPIYNEVFNGNAGNMDSYKGTAVAGVIYKKVDNKNFMIFCISSKDTWSGGRYKHCNSRIFSNKR